MSLDDQLAQLKGYADRHAPNPGEQGSIEFLMQRVGHCTGSRFKDVMDFQKSGKEGAKRAAYRMELVIERLTGRPVDHYVNDVMAWGSEHEPAARMMYEARTGAMVVEQGFLHHLTVPMVGGSVDGFVGDDGIIEIKCPTTATHIKTLLASECEHLPQIMGYLWLTNRKWADFVSFDPRMPDGLQLYVQRIERDDDYIAELAGNVLTFLVEVDAIHKSLMAMATSKTAPPLASPASPSTGEPAVGAASPLTDDELVKNIGALVDKKEWDLARDLTRSIKDEAKRMKVGERIEKRKEAA